MAISDRAGRPADPAILVDVDRLIGAYHDTRPDPADPAQRVAFGTSGHRGSSLTGAFNEAHIPATTEAICRYRETPGHGRAAVHRARHARPVRAGVRDGARRARRPRRRRPDRCRRRLHADAGDLARDPRPQPRPRATGWPTASSSPRRTTRPRTAASSTTRPTAARPTPTSRAGSRTRPTGCWRPDLDGVAARAVRRPRAPRRRRTTSSGPTSTTWRTSSTWTRSGRRACGSASTRWAARASPTGRRSPSATAST